jgi:hypothetical protein
MVRLILRRRSKAGFHQIDLTNKAAVQVVVDFPRESQAIILVPLGAERYNHETPLDVGGPLHACRFVSSRLFMVEPSAIPVNDAGGRFGLDMRISLGRSIASLLDPADRGFGGGAARVRLLVGGG